ncbi:MAG TPA: energy transducer TonB [Pyrinomonadaceae bacterium]|jgi:protein TonB|nr:energy transducer TonB [Pyrinomonadaceae bacterium]
MSKRTDLILPGVLALLLPAFALTAQAASVQSTSVGFRLASASLRSATTATDKEQDGLAGPVRRIRTETAKLMSKEGKLVEGPRQVLETATYDIKGNKIDNAYFLAAGGSLTGKEVYKYDDKGNITEMTLQNSDGTLLSKEVYTYEFDSMGNWTKMTTSVAVLEGGKITYEPTEVTYRSIAYYLEETTVAKMSQPAPAANVAAAQPANAPATNTKSPANAPAVSKATATPAPVKSGGPVTTTNAAPSSAAPLKSAATVAPGSSSPSSAAAKSSAPASVPAEVVSPDKAKVYAVSNPSAGNTSSANAGGNAPLVKDAGEAPATPAPKAPVKPISGGVLNGKAVKLPPPVYPAMARQSRTSGLVTVEVVIDATGKVISVKAVSGPSLLHQAAEQAARQARFSPTLLSGQPVKVSGVINYNFTF